MERTDNNSLGLDIDDIDKSLSYNDYEWLKPKILNSDTIKQEQWRDAFFIIPRVQLGYEVNCLKALGHSIHKYHYIICAEDTLNRIRISKKNSNLWNALVTKSTVAETLYRTVQCAKNSRIV